MTTRDREALVLSHLPLATRLARSIARRYHTSIEDAEQTAAVALIEAAHKYNEHSGKAFGAFAQRVIRNYVLEQEVRNYADAGISDHYRTTLRKFSAAQQLHPGERFEDTCSRIGYSPERVRLAIAAVRRKAFRSLDEIVGSTETDPVFLSDLVADKTCEDPADVVIRLEEARERRDAVRRGLALLPPNLRGALRAKVSGEIEEYAQHERILPKTAADRYFRAVNTLRTAVSA